MELKPRAQVQKSNGNTIKNAEDDNSLYVNRFSLKEIQASCQI